MRHMPDLDRSVSYDWYQVICVQHIFWASPNSSGFGNGRVAKWAHDLGWSQIANMADTVHQAQEEFSAGSKICWAPKYVPP